jgi:hypothetical protein
VQCAQYLGNILAIFKPVVEDFYEPFSNQGFFHSLVSPQGEVGHGKANQGGKEWQQTN